MPVVEPRELNPPPIPTNRFALVIGCNDYVNSIPLKKAINDARDMHTLLKSAGFSSTLVENATKVEMIVQQTALTKAVKRSRDKFEEVLVVVFFSGHGVDVDQSTYLLSTDHEKHEHDGLEVQSLVSELNRAAVSVSTSMTLILLTDACRLSKTNSTFRSADGHDPPPTAAEWAKLINVRNAAPPRSICRGGVSQLGCAENVLNNRFFIGSACKPGTVALEPNQEEERNGYFTKALLMHLPTPLGRVFAHAYSDVIDEVKVWTHGKQGPWSEGDISGRLVLFPQEPEMMADRLQSQTGDSDAVGSGPNQASSQVDPECAPVVDVETAPSPCPTPNAVSDKDRHTQDCEVAAHVSEGDRVAYVSQAPHRQADLQAHAMPLPPFGMVGGFPSGYFKKDWTLHAAAAFGETYTMEHLIRVVGKRVDARNDRNETALHLAAEKARLDMCQCLVDLGADINAQDRDGWSPLHIAAKFGHVETVRLLLDLGANLQASNTQGLTPLHSAASFGQTDVLKLLLAAQGGASADVRSGIGRTPLMCAVFQGHLECARVLLDSGSDVNANEWSTGETCLYRAAQVGDVRMAELLVSRGAWLKSSGPRKEWTPLQVAVHRGRAAVVKFLLQEGADPNVRSKDKFTPLHFAAVNGDADIARYLMEKKADVRARNNENRTPLFLAAQEGHLDVVLALLEGGSEVNACDNKYQTSAHAAAVGEYWDVVKLLISWGARADVPNSMNQTPLDLAKDANCEYLLQGAHNDAVVRRNTQQAPEADPQLVCLIHQALGLPQPGDKPVFAKSARTDVTALLTSRTQHQAA